MFKRRKERVAMQMCSVALLIALSTASTPAQAPLLSLASTQLIELPGASSGNTQSFAPSTFENTGSAAAHRRIGKGLMPAINEAWRLSGDGTSPREGAVLIFRMQDGSLTGRVQRFTNEQYQLSFIWDPAAVAIVHTHPNTRDPKPAEQDKRVAEKYR